MFLNIVGSVSLFEKLLKVLFKLILDILKGLIETLKKIVIDWVPQHLRGIFAINFGLSIAVGL